MISVTDVGTGYTYRAAPTYWEPYYYQPSARVAGAYVTGSHAMKIGIDVGWGSVFNRTQRTNGGMNYVFRNGAPTSITMVLSPRNEREREYHVGVYGQDQWTIKRLTVNAGLRFDYQNQWVPEQESGPGPFVPFQTWAEVDDIVGWKDLSPRLGASYDLFGDGKTALKATVSRYNVRDNTAFAIANNPLLFNATATRSWTNDANRDFVPQESELGPLSSPNFGTDRTTTVVDDRISHGWGVRPYNWEVTAAVQREVVRGVSVNAGYYRRWYGNFVATDNRSIAPADYDEFCITAPTDSRLGDVSGTRMCGLYDLTPAAFVRPPSNFRTRASDYGTQKETFDGIDVNVNARLPYRIQLIGGIATGTSNNSGNALVNSTEACFVIDAPHFVQGTIISPFDYCRIEYPWRTQAKVMGTIGLPWGMDAGATFQSNPGPEINANLAVTSAQVQFVNASRTTLNAGSATVGLIRPGTDFGDRIYQLDLRVTKGFNVRGARIRAIADFGNVLNSSTVLLQNNTYGTNWLRPSYIMPGRLFKPTIEVSF
jgi:hypothetical protein